MKTILFSRQRIDRSEPVLITEMFHLGLDEFHINKHIFEKRHLEEFLDMVPEEYHNRIVLHTMHSLAAKYRLKGVHLYRKYRDRNLMNVIRLRYLRFKHPDIQFSCSSGKLANLYEDSEFISEIILSPIFDSISKKLQKGFQSAFTETQLRHGLHNTKFSVIAFGGVEEDKIIKLKEMGFHGIALKGAVWKAEDPLGAFKRIVTLAKS